MVVPGGWRERGVGVVYLSPVGQTIVSLAGWGGGVHSGQPRASAENWKTNREPQPDGQINQILRTGQ